MYQLGFIGAGNMAAAILGGVLRSGFLTPRQMCVFDVNPERRALFAGKGLAPLYSSAQVVAESRFILLAVKPQNIEAVLTEAAPAFTPDKTIISIAAGISSACIRRLLGYEEAKIVLVMPNTPLLIGEGAVAMSRGEGVGDEEFSFSMSLFSAAGKVEEIPPSLMNEIIPVNGSSPALIYLLAKTVSEYAEKKGIPYETANRLFCQTLIGSARMMLQSGRSHQELINMVTSPGGTTFKMLDGLKEGGFPQAVEDSFDRCIKRAYELGK